MFFCELSLFKNEIVCSDDEIWKKIKMFLIRCLALVSQLAVQEGLNDCPVMDR
jgi:hypothetical protein